MNELEIFGHASDIEDPQQRAEYLADACCDQPQLRQRIERLILQSQRQDSFMEPSIGSRTSKSADAMPAATVGTLIGPYKLKEKIGEGGMGIVYVAEQKEPVRRRVALKVIKPGMDSRQVIARFEAERQALAMMDHPNIARVLDVGTTEQGLPYFVMELVNGTPINQYCDENQLSITERLSLFRAVCEGVQHAHQKGIIHRDLKPTNILVAQYDSSPVPKVIDFGVAKATGQSLTDHSVYTQLGQVLGTIEYMSPEQAQRNQLDIDTRSDIYSLGVVLYELLTGEVPFDKNRLRNAALDELLRILREEEPPRPSTRVSTSQSRVDAAKNRKADPSRLGPLFRGELDWIVMKAMEKDRGRRYETANSLGADIVRYLNDEPVQACPPTTGYRMVKFWRRNRAWVLPTLCVSLILLVLSLVAFWQAVKATRASRDATKSNQALERALNDLADEKSESDRQRDQASKARQKAESLLRQTNEAVDSMYMEFAEQWLKRKRLRSDQIAFLKKAANYYEIVASDQGMQANPLQMALIRQRLGRVYRALVQLDDAVTSLKASEQMFAALLDDFPKHPSARHELAVTRDLLSMTQLQKGDLNQARETAQIMLADCNAWHLAEPSNVQLAIDMAVARKRVASSLDEDSASGYFVEAAEILEAIIQEGRDESIKAKNELALTYKSWSYKLGQNPVDMDISQFAEVVNRGSIIAEELVDADPSVYHRVLHLYFKMDLATVQSKSGNHELENDLNQEIMSEIDSLAIAYPEDPEIVGLLVGMSLNLAAYSINTAGSQSSENLEQIIREASENLRTYVLRFPEDVDTASWQWVFIKNVHQTAKKQAFENVEWVADVLNDAVSLLQSEHVQWPQEVKDRNLAFCLRNLVHIHSVQRDLDGFSAAQESCLELTSHPIEHWDDLERLRLRCQIVTACCNPIYFDAELAEAVCKTAVEQSGDFLARACLGEVYYRTERYQIASDQFLISLEQWLSTPVESVEDGEIYGLMAYESFGRNGREQFEIFGTTKTIQEGQEIFRKIWADARTRFDHDRLEIAEKVFQYFDER